MELKIKKKLIDYFEDTGVQKAWFAKKLGISPAMLWQIMSGRITLPLKHWVKALEYGRGFITIEDLMNDHIYHVLRKNPYANIKQNKMGDTWTINIKHPSYLK